MGELSESQLILLDNLIYLDGVANRNGKTVKVIVNDLLKGGLDKNRTVKDGIVSYPGQMSREEWITVLQAIKKDPQLMNLKVKHGEVGNVYDKSGNLITDGHGKPLEVGARMATFVETGTDEAGKPIVKEATVVFRGTSGDLEWHDNGTGGYLTDTEMQQRALAYIEKLPYSNITVTGHSKGGNKAQYVGILSDKVDRVVSLDGQGFSKEFVEKYKDLIEANSHKITSVSAENDYVNCLLIPVAGKIIYIDTEYQKDFLRNHSPGIVLDENGQLREVTNQGAIPQLVNDLTIYLNAHMEEPDRSYAMDGLLALMESGEEGFQKESQSQTDQSIKIVLPYVGDYLLEKAAQGGKDFGGLLASALGAAVMPREYLDDFLRYLKINADNFGYMFQLGKEVGTIIKDIVLEKLSGFLSDLADKISDKAKAIGDAIASFAGKIKDGWDAMVRGIENFFADVKHAGEAAMQAVNRFMDKLVQGVQNFCNWIAEGTRKAIEAAKNAWNSSVDKVKSWFGDVKESISNKVGALKNGIKHVVELTREGFRKFIDASVTKAKEIGNWLVTKLDQARNTAIEIGAKVSAAFTAMADKLKAGWESVKTGMKNLAGNIKETAVRVAEAMARFAQTLSRAVKSFCDKIVAAYKRMMEGLKQGWDNLVGNISTLFSKATNLIRQEVDEFKDNVKSAVSMTRGKVKDFGKQAVKGIKGFTGKVVKGMSKISGGLLMVSVNRLTDLQSKFKRMDDDFVSTTSRIVNDAERIASNVSRAYSESNVQSQIRQLQRAIDDVRNRRNQVAAEMQRKIRSLSMARDQYVKIERMLKSNIGNLT
ncbi:DUF2974 domain-containing protein [Paenibacillus oralis]|uniref:DUF2974 domain-containing protein n=1 Tax=Paenibacillus oralis TaxID=2490856 RepID=A0A3P3U9F6_9BACL|nr:Mbeg1-like protein [Paenibacillus oralis]RRJ66920.1 DUF2974 domain-containing protein [Paenibacillus oralis]